MSITKMVSEMPEVRLGPRRRGGYGNLTVGISQQADLQRTLSVVTIHNGDAAFAFEPR
jgi:hypothetical protein